MELYSFVLFIPFSRVFLPKETCFRGPIGTTCHPLLHLVKRYLEMLLRNSIVNVKMEFLRKCLESFLELVILNFKTSFPFPSLGNGNDRNLLDKHT